MASKILLAVIAMIVTFLSVSIYASTTIALLIGTLVFLVVVLMFLLSQNLALRKRTTLSLPIIYGVSTTKIALAPSDESLFKFMNGEYRNIINQFALAVFGIGAFFFAVGQVKTETLKLLIDLIAFGASVTMWIHMYGAYRQIEAIRNELGTTSPAFMCRYQRINSWRHIGSNIVFYYPVTRLMTYFMGLVAWAWLTLILNGLGWPPWLLFTFSIVILMLTFMLALVRRIDDLQNFYDP